MNSKLDYFVEKLEGFATNYFKVEPLGSSSAVANQIIRFELPPSTIINFRSIVFNFTAEITSASGYGRLPSYTSTLINNVHLEINGKAITSNHNFYNILAQAKRIYKDETDCPLLEHTELWRKVNPKTAEISNSSNKLEKESEYCVKFNESILGTIEPEYIDTSLLGRVHLVITLAPNEVCTDSSGLDLARGSLTTGFDIPATNSNPVYKLSNMYLTLEQCGFSNGVYDSLIANQMSNNKGLYLPFKNYYHFYNESNTQLAFTCATQSLDRIILIHHASGWNTAKIPSSPNGYISALDASNSNTEFWRFNKIMDYNKEYYLSKYISFNAPSGLNSMGHQLSINSGLYPQFIAKQSDMVNITKNSLPYGAKMKNISFYTWLRDFCVYNVRFNIQGSEERRQISGFNTKNISANMYYNITGVNNATPLGISVFCETTATLVVRAGQICEVIN